MIEADPTSAHSFRALALLGMLGAAGLALLVLPGDAALAADAGLLLVMQAMALIKAALLAGLGRGLWVRARWPLPRPTALAYLLPVWLMAGATGAIWRGDAIALSALVFHLGLATLVVTAWRDRGPEPVRRRAPAADTGQAPDAEAPSLGRAARGPSFAAGTRASCAAARSTAA